MEFIQYWSSHNKNIYLAYILYVLEMGAVCNKFKRNKGRKISESNNIMCKGPCAPFITERQKTILKDNWSVLKEHIANFGVITFVR